MKTEQRSCRAELRAESGFRLAGIAAATGTVARIGNFNETIAKGAFTRALRERQNVFCLREHNPNFVLGATKSGTLSLSETDNGSLAFMCQLDPKQSSHVDLYHAVQRGDLDSMSFGFAVNGDAGEEWRTQGKEPLRVLKDVDLYDVSVVCNPAYSKGTSVSARSVDYTPVARSLAVPTLAFLNKQMQKQKAEIFRTWPKEWGFAEVKDEHGNTVDFRCVTAQERDQINRAKVRLLGEQIRAEEEEREACECDCPECEDGVCEDCTNEKCTDENCLHGDEEDQ